MKKVIVAMALLVAVSGMAQKDDQAHRGNRSDLNPEQMATLKTKKMTLALDLTEAQQAQIQALNLANAKAHQSKMEERKAMKEKGEESKPTPEEKFSKQTEHLDAKIAHKAEMKKILSQEQFEKWEKMAHHKGHHGKRKGKKGEGRDRHKKEGRK